MERGNLTKTACSLRGTCFHFVGFLVVLDADEVGQHLGVVPALRPESRPQVEVVTRASDPHERVDAARAAQDPPARPDAPLRGTARTNSVILSPKDFFVSISRIGKRTACSCISASSQFTVKRVCGSCPCRTARILSRLARLSVRTSTRVSNSEHTSTNLRFPAALCRRVLEARCRTPSPRRLAPDLRTCGGRAHQASRPPRLRPPAPRRATPRLPRGGSPRRSRPTRRPLRGEKNHESRCGVL